MESIIGKDIRNDFGNGHVVRNDKIMMSPIELLSLVLRKNGLSGFPTRSHTNRAVQLQKMARGLKFRIYIRGILLYM